MTAWSGGRRLTATRPAIGLCGLALPALAGGLVTGRSALVAGALALLGAVALDALSAWWAVPGVAGAVGVRPEGDAVAVAGDTVGYRISVAAASRPLTVGRVGWAVGTAVLLPAGEDGGPVSAGASLIAPARGLYPEESFSVAARGPLGLVACRRVETVTHRPALAVGPAPVPHVVRWPAPAAARMAAETRSARGDELYRGVRPYTRGDTRRSVHWPATARHGSLMVRETEGTAARTVRLVVDLPSPGPAAEVALGRAAWLAGEAHRQGWAVWLVTGEAGGVVSGVASGSAAVARRLAAASPGTARPAPEPTGVPTRWISPGGDRWA
jgi:uncharacterized protein (DUF58 family)